MDRKEMIRKYKDTPVPAGVFRLRNHAVGKSLVAAGLNLTGMINRHRFQLDHGSHPNRDLQADWNRLGADAFVFETLDQLEPTGDADENPAEELKVLLQMWIEKLKESGEPLYQDV